MLDKGVILCLTIIINIHFIIAKQDELESKYGMIDVLLSDSTKVLNNFWLF